MTGSLPTAIGQTITINFPSTLFGFAGTIGLSPATIAGTTTATIASTASTLIVLTVATLAIPANTQVTAVFTNAWSTGVQQAASTFSVLTSVDLSATGTTPVIGGQISAVSLTIAQILPATATVFTVAFKTGSVTGNSLAIGQTITINFPALLFGFAANIALSPTTIAGTTTATIASTVSTQIVLTVATAAIPANTQVAAVFTAVWTTGAAQAAYTACAVSVSTTVDALGVATANSAISGQISDVVLTIPLTGTTILPSTASVFTVAFKTGTVNPTAIGQTITINFPTGLFGFAANIALSPTTIAGTTTATIASTVSTQIVLTVATLAIPANTQVTAVFTAVWTTGAMQPANPGSVTVVSSIDRMSAAVSAPAIGGQVTAASLTGGSNVPGKAGVLVTVAFTLATALPTGSVTITWPAGLFAASSTPAVSGTNWATTSTSGGVNVWIVGGGSSTPVAGTQSLVFTATMASPALNLQPCGSSFWVSTNNDFRSVASSNTVPALGGQVTGVSLSVSSRAPTAATQTASVTFTLATALTSTQKITVNWPTGFFDSTAPSAVSGSALFATGAAAVSGNSWTVTGATSPPTAGTYTLIFAGVKMGPLALAANPIGITVSSDTDLLSAGATSGPLGGQITGVSVSIAAGDRVPAATAKMVTVSFTTQFALTSGQLVTITFPGSFLTGTIAVTAAATFAATTTPVSTTGLTIAIGSAGATVGSYTLTLTGATMPVATAAGSGTACSGYNFAVNTPFDLSGGANLPMIGGKVTGVSFSVATADRVPALTAKTVTVSFTTQTVLASAQLVTIMFPASYISASIGVTYAGAANTFAITATAVGTTGLTIAVGTAGAVAGSYTVTLTGATMGGPMPAMTTGVSVSTTTDFAGVTGYPALGGVVTGAALTIASADRIAANANRKITVSFTTTTTLASGGFITITIPLVTGGTNGAVTGITATAAISSGSIVLTVGAGGLAAGVATVVICGVTLGSYTTNNLVGVVVSTTMDYTSTCSATGTVGTQQGTVTAVSMTIPFANRMAGTTQTVTFSFTTATALPASSSNCGAANSVTIYFPTSFFVDNGVGACSAAAAALSVSGLTGYALSANAIGPTSSTTFVLTGTGPLPAATYTVIISSLKLGAQMVGVDSGSLSIRVKTSMDAVSSGSPSGPISGYQVTSVTMPSSCQASNTCQSLVIAFSSTAGSIAAGTNLVISFTAPAPFSGTADAFMVGNALITPGAVASNSITLAVSRAAWAIGATTTITFTSLTVVSSGLQSTTSSVAAINYVSVGGSTPAYSMMFSPTGTGKTTTTSLTVARPFPGVTNTMATMVFSTTMGISTGNVIRVFYPTGFFIGTPQVGTCGSMSDSYPFGASGLGVCSVLSVTDMGVVAAVMTPTGPAAQSMSYIDVTYTGTGQAAGSQTFMFSGATLSATAVSASSTFSIVTTQNSCSAGMISTGAISNSNPGGPSAPAAAGTSLLLSAAAALACALLLLL